MAPTGAIRLGAGARDDTALALQIPSDGSVGSLRGLLDRLDREAIAVEALSVHTPDLDDVFLNRRHDSRRDDGR